MAKVEKYMSKAKLVLLRKRIDGKWYEKDLRIPSLAVGGPNERVRVLH
jgi:hypothetical protein